MLKACSRLKKAIVGSSQSSGGVPSTFCTPDDTTTTPLNAGLTGSAASDATKHADNASNRFGTPDSGRAVSNPSRQSDSNASEALVCIEGINLTDPDGCLAISPPTSRTPTASSAGPPRQPAAHLHTGQAPRPPPPPFDKRRPPSPDPQPSPSSSRPGSSARAPPAEPKPPPGQASARAAAVDVGSGAGPTAAPQPSASGVGGVGPGTAVLGVSPACPASLRRDEWNINDFFLVSKIYGAKVSRVYHARDPASGLDMALKLYKRDAIKEMHKVQAIREITFHCSIAHPNIICMYAAWADPVYIYMLLEYAPLGDLYRILRYRGSLPEKMVVSEVLMPIFGALEYLHSQDLVHRDLKPENILVTKAGVKVADFGLVINDEEEKPNTRLGTLDYMAPEIYAAKHKTDPMQGKFDGSDGYSSKVDIWAVGVITFELLTGAPPFESEFMGTTIQKICALEYAFPPNFPPAAQDFIQRILQKDPALRPTVADLRAHPWIVNTSTHKATPIQGARQGTGAAPSGAGAAGAAAANRSTVGLPRRTRGSTSASMSWRDTFNKLEPNNRLTERLLTRHVGEASNAQGAGDAPVPPSAPRPM